MLKSIYPEPPSLELQITDRIQRERQPETESLHTTPKRFEPFRHQPGGLPQHRIRCGGYLRFAETAPLRVGVRVLPVDPEERAAGEQPGVRHLRLHLDRPSAVETRLVEGGQQKLQLCATAIPSSGSLEESKAIRRPPARRFNSCWLPKEGFGIPFLVNMPRSPVKYFVRAEYM